MTKTIALFFLILLISVPTFADAAVRTKARTSPPSVRKTARLDFNCSQFASQAEAQKKFLEGGGLGNDIYDLDRDKDGIACESLT